MIAREALLSIRPPFLHLLAGGVSDITDFAWSLAASNDDVVVRCLRGQKMLTVERLFDEFAAALQFPYYLGENWPAFHECLTDLSWLPGRAYILFIWDTAMLLRNEPLAEMAALCRALQAAGEEWATPVKMGEPWDRPAVPFHVLLQCTEPEYRVVQDRLASVGAFVEDGGQYSAPRES